MPSENKILLKYESSFLRQCQGVKIKLKSCDLKNYLFLFFHFLKYYYLINRVNPYCVLQCWFHKSEEGLLLFLLGQLENQIPLYNQIHSSPTQCTCRQVGYYIYTAVQPDPQQPCTVYMQLVGLLYIYSCTTRSTAALHSVHVVRWIIKYVQMYNQIQSSPGQCTCSQSDYYYIYIYTVVQPDPQQP